LVSHSVDLHRLNSVGYQKTPRLLLAGRSGSKYTLKADQGQVGLCGTG
jgi:hypothetical protein